MILDFDKNIREFLSASRTFKVKMLLVGGGAVNFHGYQRHSADLDFWIDTNEGNLQNLLKALSFIGLDIDDFPQQVKDGEQNISIKISPISDIELITNFNVNKSFDQAYEDGIEYSLEEYTLVKYSVISLEDLLISKIKAGRNKDLLDIQELKRINNL